ncbi:ribokinase [Shouchella sp. 1P09AA]|uniref:ribokinase n=1 Tax=unclassified Shouchella TaxID=2893065 RepID=UPI00399FEA3B
MNKPKVTVIGSINMDMVTTTPRVPNQGETIIGEAFQTAFGGKGANQAVAAARLGADVTMIGRVGDDAFGRLLLEGLQKEGIHTSSVVAVEKESSGVATILLSEKDNRIIVTPGANHYVDQAYLEAYRSTIKESDLVLVQLEIPLDAVDYAMNICQEEGVPVMLNPAPAQTLSLETYKQATYLTPNESEYNELFLTLDDQLKDKLIVTQGSNGVKWMEQGIEKWVAGHQVNVVDTTGAGDTFNGALAVAIARKEPLENAVLFANAAAALSVQAFGAQMGMPTEEHVHRFLKEAGGR